MRALLLVLVACTPDIGSGVYLCGPNEACPEGQTCDGSTNACVDPVTAIPFACRGNGSDDTAATASAIESVSCVSPELTELGCMNESDPANWYSFTAPAECTSVQVVARVSYPVAWETPKIVLGDASGNQLAEDTDCDQPSLTGDAVRCLTQTLTPGTSYTLAIEHSGNDACDGACAFNRYNLSIRLSTPH